MADWLAVVEAQGWLTVAEVLYSRVIPWLAGWLAGWLAVVEALYSRVILWLVGCC